MSGYRVRRNDREWVLSATLTTLHPFRISPPGAATSVLPVRWNGYLMTGPSNEWGWAPVWLPIAWYCCEADPADGPNFASAILDAGTDDAPALIAADWLEERGLRGELRKDNKGGLLDLVAEAAAGATGFFTRLVPPDWFTSRMYWLIPREGLGPDEWSRGPIASWARLLIKSMCLTCGAPKERMRFGKRQCPACGGQIAAKGGLALPTIIDREPQEET